MRLIPDVCHARLKTIWGALSRKFGMKIGKKIE
jgi:hypothetical protein